MQKFTKKKILLVEDDESFSEAFAEQLALASGGLVVVARDAYEAFEKLTNNSFDLIVTDLRLPAIDGVSSLGYLEKFFRQDPSDSWFHTSDRPIPFVVVTAEDAEKVPCVEKRYERFHCLGVVSKRNRLHTIVQQTLALTEELKSVA